MATIEVIAGLAEDKCCVFKNKVLALIGDFIQDGEEGMFSKGRAVGDVPPRALKGVEFGVEAERVQEVLACLRHAGYAAYEAKSEGGQDTRGYGHGPDAKRWIS